MPHTIHFKASVISTYDVSTLYTTLPHNHVADRFVALTEKTFAREKSKVRLGKVAMWLAWCLSQTNLRTFLLRVFICGHAKMSVMPFHSLLTISILSLVTPFIVRQSVFQCAPIVPRLLPIYLYTVMNAISFWAYLQSHNVALSMLSIALPVSGMTF